METAEEGGGCRLESKIKKINVLIKDYYRKSESQRKTELDI